MTTPTCSTCRFWGAQRPEDGDEGFARIKEDVELWAKVRPCGAVMGDPDGSGAFPHRLPADRKAEVLDGSGYYASLRTREDFGCVLHEEA